MAMFPELNEVLEVSWSQMKAIVVKALKKENIVDEVQKKKALSQRQKNHDDFVSDDIKKNTKWDDFSVGKKKGKKIPAKLKGGAKFVSKETSSDDSSSDDVSSDDSNSVLLEAIVKPRARPAAASGSLKTKKSQPVEIDDSSEDEDSDDSESELYQQTTEDSTDDDSSSDEDESVARAKAVFNSIKTLSQSKAKNTEDDSDDEDNEIDVEGDEEYDEIHNYDEESAPAAKMSKKDSKCLICNETVHVPRQYPKKNSGITCYNCNESGHTFRDCPKKTSGKNAGRGSGNITCYRCNETGHTTKDCPKPNDMICFGCEEMGFNFSQ
ncbi:CCHC-type zinc finger nucleic acid binding protein [Pseudolycoriella hygida]|uniref:Zinc finger CCHC domain-containing protein 7 n=1 Tax=Pseudolycoriella hygida TaxID=35572 RepID=A0A9Q0RXA0_9DIPT|nr:CCHC-type zinc finger nucleic acid binding protein [Pseudolycoriella hygida]